MKELQERVEALGGRTLAEVDALRKQTNADVTLLATEIEHVQQIAPKLESVEDGISSLYECMCALETYVGR